MFFIEDKENKILFGNNAKSGTQHVRTLFRFLKDDITDLKTIGKKIFSNKIYPKAKLVNNINTYKGYTLIIFFRNPYERLVSAYREKYTKEKKNRFKFKNYDYLDLKFNLFVEDLIKNKFKNIDNIHFKIQSDIGSNNIINILENADNIFSNIVFYDIKNIDYSYLEKLYNKTIPEHIKHFKGSHVYEDKIQHKPIFDKPVFDLQYREYKDYKVDYGHFYNQKIKDKIKSFFKKDFDFAKKFGNIDYDVTIFNSSNNVVEHFGVIRKSNNKFIYVAIFILFIIIIIFTVKFCSKKK